MRNDISGSITLYKKNKRLSFVLKDIVNDDRALPGTRDVPKVLKKSPTKDVIYQLVCLKDCEKERKKK